MALEEGAEAPYGPPSAVLMVLQHFRQREIPGSLTETNLSQLGVKDSVLRLVWRSLIFLGLMDDKGATTEHFKALRYATDEDYARVFRDILTAAYGDIFALADPATATRAQLFNLFRPYSPASQHDRMVTLFLALCQHGGIQVADAPKASPARPAGDRPQKVTTRPARKPGQTPPAPPAAPPSPSTSGDLQRDYFLLLKGLVEKGGTDTDLTDLLDRMEGVIGLAASNARRRSARKSVVMTAKAPAGAVPQFEGEQSSGIGTPPLEADEQDGASDLGGDA